MENPIKMDDLGGTIIFGNTHITYPINWGMSSVKIWAETKSTSLPFFQALALESFQQGLREAGYAELGAPAIQAFGPTAWYLS